MIVGARLPTCDGPRNVLFERDVTELTRDTQT